MSKKFILFFKFLKDYFNFKKENKKDRFNLYFRDIFLCLEDNLLETKFDGHYVYHVVWVARILKRTKLQKHVDISPLCTFVL